MAKQQKKRILTIPGIEHCGFDVSDFEIVKASRKIGAFFTFRTKGSTINPFEVNQWADTEDELILKLVNFLEIYPLVKEGYAILDCPNCNKKCFPDAKGIDGTIIYNRHDCKGPYDLNAISRRFEIDPTGDILEIHE
jgi:hypothetical protein